MCLVFIDENLFTPEGLAAARYMVPGEAIRGYPDGSFKPQNPITREEATIIAKRLLNWPALAADDALDSTAFIPVFAGNSCGGGSSSWRAPRCFMTNEHVAITTAAKPDGGYSYTENDFLALANGGWVRNNRAPESEGGEPPFYVIWDKYQQDWRDLAYLIVPEPLWLKYLAAREAAGLPREPRYVNPHESRDVVQGEPILVTGSPLMYDNVITEGIVSKVHVAQNSEGRTVEYVMTTAAINPGNSGGMAMTFDRRFVGIPSLKPWTRTAFGMSIGDDMGLILHWREILAWEAKFAAEFRYAGIDLG